MVKGNDDGKEAEADGGDGARRDDGSVPPHAPAGAVPRDEVRAAYAKGAADMCQRAVRLVGEHLGPAPMLPYLPEGDGYGPSEFWECHDPDDWRQWDDVPKELADCEWRRAAGHWTPCRADDRDVPCPVDRSAETGA